ERRTGMAWVQLYRREQRDFDTFDEIDRQHRDANVRSIFYYAAFYPGVELVSARAASLSVWVGGGWVVNGDGLTLGALVAFLQYSQRFFRPISDLSEKFNLLQGAMASSERIFALLDTPVEITSPAVSRRGASLDAPTLAAPSDAPISSGTIRFEDVTFSYVEGEPVLRNVSFEVRPGQRVAIVGATGSGKTTIVSLLQRFYDVQQGRITIDAVDIPDWDLASLLRLFGLVLQDVYLFSGTIGGNVRLGNAAITDADVRRALEAVHASRFIDRLPHGVNTPVT